MDWDAFMRGELAIYCASEAQALELLDMFDAQGLDTIHQRETFVERRRDLTYSYRWGVEREELCVVHLWVTESWEWHKENGMVSSVCRFSEITESMSNPSITTLDGLL